MVDYSQRVIYRYFLNENFKGESCSFNGLVVTKTPKDFDSKLEELDPYIRTKYNPTGMVDYQVINPYSNGSNFDSKEIFEKDLKIYSREEIALMNRDEIITICQIYNIPVVNMRTEILAKLILEKQIEAKKYIETVNKKDKKKEPEASNVVIDTTPLTDEEEKDNKKAKKSILKRN